MSDFMTCIEFIFSSFWKFFTSVTIPGLNMSFAVLYVGVAMVYLSFKFIAFLMSK